jgi:molybdenum cofactor cytidylyltransferase
VRHAIVGVLLAAGGSTRFGSDKLAAAVTVDGMQTTVLQATAQALHAACEHAIAVTRPGSPHTAALRELGFEVIEAADAAEGMGASLAAAARRLQQHQAAGCLVMLADLPFIRIASVRAVKQALESGASLAVPRHRGERGHPVGFAAAHFAALAALRGDAGAKGVLRANEAHIRFIELDDPGILHDVDTPQRLRTPPR